VFFLFSIIPVILFSQNTPEHNVIISVERIWDRAAHNAFTSLIYHNNKFYCSFRESAGHVSDLNGTIRVIASDDDGQNWYSVAHLYERDVDLRDPQLSVTPDNRIMLNMGGSVYIGGKLVAMQPKVSFSDKTGNDFSIPQNVVIDKKIKTGKDWLWRVTWHEGTAYGGVYQTSKDKSVQLVKSTDGLNYTFVTTFDVIGGNETTLRFTPDNKMIAVVRRGKGNGHGFIGSSIPPYKSWKWNELDVRLGGPDLIILADGKMICGTREYGLNHKTKTILAQITLDGDFTKLITLPSAGDCSYPGLALKDSLLYISYYSSHDEKTAIYLAKTFDLNWAYESTIPIPAPYLKSEKSGLIEISCTAKKAEIRYTIDGSIPTQSTGFVYQKPFTVSRTTKLRMLALLPGRPASKIVSMDIGSDIFQEALKIDNDLINGLTYQYFEGEVSQTTEIEKLPKIKTGTCSKFSIKNRQRNNNFAYIFEGYISIPEDGTYTFYLKSNDGSRLYLDDFLLINNDGPHGIKEEGAVVSLKKGFHKIKLKYFQMGGGQILTVSWKGAKFKKSEIPAKVLYHKDQDFSDAVLWLEKEAFRIIRASKRTMNDGTAAFPPQVGIGYEAFWLRDYSYTLEGSVNSYSDKELKEACSLFIQSMHKDGAGVDCVRFDGTPIYKPGFGSLGKNSVADGSQFTVAVAWHTFLKTKDKKFLKKIIDPLIKTMNAVPRNPDTHLVHIIPGKEQERCPYGFTDTISKQGDVLFCSLLFVQASHRLSGLLDVLGRTKEADNWEREGDLVAENIRKVFWDAKTGLFRAATICCKEHDIWGSAFATYLGVADEKQSKAIASYFQKNYKHVVQKGQIRHLPGGVYWEKALCKQDTYQNGAYWATPTGWFVYTLDLVDPVLANQTVIDMVNDFKENGANEWIFDTTYKLPNYLASASLPLAGIRAMMKRRNKN